MKKLFIVLIAAAIVTSNVNAALNYTQRQTADKTYTETAGGMLHKAKAVLALGFNQADTIEYLETRKFMARQFIDDAIQNLSKATESVEEMETKIPEANVPTEATPSEADPAKNPKEDTSALIKRFDKSTLRHVETKTATPNFSNDEAKEEPTIAPKIKKSSCTKYLVWGLATAVAFAGSTYAYYLTMQTNQQ